MKNVKPKVKAAGIGGTIATLALLLFNFEISAEVAAAITTLVSFAFGFIKAE